MPQYRFNRRPQLPTEENFWHRSTEPAFIADCLGWRILKWKDLHPLQLDKGQVQGGRELLFLDAPFSCTHVHFLLCVILGARLFVSPICILFLHSSMVYQERGIVAHSFLILNADALEFPNCLKIIFAKGFSIINFHHLSKLYALHFQIISKPCSFLCCCTLCSKQ